MKKRLKRYAKAVYRRLPNPVRTQAAIWLHRQPPAAVDVGVLTYAQWIDTIEPQTFAPVTQDGPLISIVVPAYNTADKYLVPMINSVLGQTYGHWQLVLVDGCTIAERSEAIAAQADRDERITLVKVGENRGIVGNTNAGLSEARGEFTAFLDHDDTLAPQALNEIVVALQANPKIGLFYTDEDKLSEDGNHRSLPILKPDWSPELLLGVNYMAHFVVARASLVQKVGGLRPGFDGSQDYDFLLRVIDHSPVIHHIPKVLYHFRFADSSTATDIASKGYADDAGQRALREYVERNKIPADVIGVADRPTNYRLKYRIQHQPLISIIVPFKDKPELLEQLMKSLENQTYEHFEYILVSNNSVEPATHALLDRLKKDPRVTVVVHDQPFNWSQVNNVGRRQAKGEYLLFLNNDTEARHPEFLEELLGVAAQPWAGVVGGWLFYPDNTTQHAGVAVLGPAAMAINLFKRVLPFQWTNFGMPDWPRNYLAVTGACQMIRAELFDKLGGFDEEFIMCGSDVVFGIKAHEAGYRNVFWPFAKMTHYESVSVKSYANAPASDYERSLVFYGPYFTSGDPFYNPNLTRTREDLSLRETLS